MRSSEGSTPWRSRTQTMFDLPDTHGDPLLQPEEVRGDPGVHPVGQPVVALLEEALDDRRGMDPRRGLEGVLAEDRVVRRQGDAHAASRQLHVVGEGREVAVEPAQQLQVHEEEVHLHVASPLPDAHGRAGIWVAPASMAAMALARPRPRSRWPCQSIPTSCPLSSTMPFTKVIRERTPEGVTGVAHADALGAGPDGRLQRRARGPGGPASCPRSRTCRAE